MTAGHCIAFSEAAGWRVVGVSFDSVISSLSTATLLEGTSHLHPDYAYFGEGGINDPADLGVLVLDRSAAEVYPDITPASLPTAGLLDQLNVRNGLKGQRFTTVGFGRLEPQFGGGPPVHPRSAGVRRVADSRFLALFASWLQMSQVGVRGDGGTCFGDSGGPTFLGAGADQTDVLVSITSWGDAMCVAVGTTYRLDLPSARQFLGQFVNLP